MRHLFILILLTVTSCISKQKEPVKVENPIVTTDIQIEFNLLNTVLENLTIEKKNCKLDLVVSKQNPNNPEETIIVIPEIVEDGEHYNELNSYILIVNTETGKIVNNFYESSKTNRWVSDTAELIEISIDTSPYYLSDWDRAFGIRVKHVGSLIANPYKNEFISLFIESKNTLEKILINFDTMNYGGERISSCFGEFVSENRVLMMTNNKTNNYFDILVNSKITETINFKNENGDCDSKVNTITEKRILKFNGKTYKQIDLIDTVLENLTIEKKNCKLDLVVSKQNPNNPEETIIVIPEIVEEGEHYIELNSHILIVERYSGKIISNYFENSKTNGWISDAIQLVEISIDTAPYNLTKNERAFGIRVRYVGSSQVNPYESEHISLYLNKNKELKQILKKFTTKKHTGAWNADCEGEFMEENKILVLSKKSTNGYSDIIVKTTTSNSIAFLNKDNDCDEKETVSKTSQALKYNNGVYN